MGHSAKLFVAMLFFACTTESKIKPIILEQSRSSFESQIREEAEKAVASKSIYKANYYSAIFSKTEYEVEHLEAHSDTATAQVQVLSTSEKVRNAVLEIIEKRSNDNGYSVNIADAIRLVNAQMRIQNETQLVQTYQFKLKQDGGNWKIVTQDIVAVQQQK